MKFWRFLALSLAVVLTAGCVTAAGRQGAADSAAVLGDVATNGAQPGDPRVQAAAEAAEGVRQQVGGPAPVLRSAEEIRANAIRIMQDVALWNRFKAVGGALLESAKSWGPIGGVVTTGLAVAGWLLRKKNQAEEAGNRIASTYREAVPEGVRAAVDQTLAGVLKAKGLPVAQAEKFVGWENVPDA